MKLLTLAQQQDLVNRKLATSKQVGDLITFKYSRRVMYDYLWKKHPECMESRGHTYDVNTGEIVLAAPTKSFNYLEDNWWSDVPLDTKVDIYKKYNGFMASLNVYNGEIVVGTTGTTNSDYAVWAKEMILKKYEKYDTYLSGEEYIKMYFPRDITMLYEICHPEDPHIVNEEPGAKYLGFRYNNHPDFDWFIPCQYYDSNTPTEYYRDITLEEALKIVENYKHEGFMCYDAMKPQNVCKLKSPYYVGKKKLMRANDALVDRMYSDTRQFNMNTLPEMWYDVAQEITERFYNGDWKSMTDQQRRIEIELIEKEI